MKEHHDRDSLSEEAFVDWLTREGRDRYHDHHPFNRLMHEGQLTRLQLQQWVLNRYYYQTRIPIKDALILSKAEDSHFRRIWLHRIQDHDGTQEGDGGLSSWLALARGVGLDPEEVRCCRSVLPGVRLACDGYVQFVRENSLLEAVAASLTELFAPTLLAQRIHAWERHYPWIKPEALEYFETRISRASSDSQQAIEFVVAYATTYELQERCVRALIKKAEILWHLLDCLYATYVGPGWEAKAGRHELHHHQTAAQS